jgi:hypothetical protein
MHWLRCVFCIFTTCCCNTTRRLRLLHACCYILLLLLQGCRLGWQLLLLLLARVQVPRQGLQLTISVHTPFVPLVPCIEASAVALHQDGLQAETDIDIDRHRQTDRAIGRTD